MKILYFAWIRQRVGLGQEILSGNVKASTVGDLIEELRAKGENYAAAFQDLAVIKVAVNQTFADFETPISDSDEIAFFPPVTGG
jgi:molybdopterin synthase sulfur carrier subunit